MRAGLAFCEMLSLYQQSVFRGSLGGRRGGQQQFATQTIRVHLLGLEKVTLVNSVQARCIAKTSGFARGVCKK